MSNKNRDTDYSQLPIAVGFAIDQKLKGLHTAIPAHIVRYVAATKRATVKPAIRLKLTDGTTRERALIADVPVIHPSGGGYMVHLPLAAGDPVMLVFSERGIAKFKAAYKLADPDLESRLSAKDAVAIPGFGALNVAPAGAGLTVQTEDGASFIEVTPGQVTVKSPGGLVVDGGVAITGGAVTHNGANIGDTHRHGGIIRGPATTDPPA